MALRSLLCVLAIVVGAFAADPLPEPGPRYTANTSALLAEVLARDADLGIPITRAERRLKSAYARVIPLLTSGAPTFEADLKSGSKAARILARTLRRDDPMQALLRTTAGLYGDDLRREVVNLYNVGNRFLPPIYFHDGMSEEIIRADQRLGEPGSSLGVAGAFHRCAVAERMLGGPRDIVSEFLGCLPGKVLLAGEGFTGLAQIPGLPPDVPVSFDSVSASSGSIYFFLCRQFAGDTFEQYSGDYVRIELPSEPAIGAPMEIGPVPASVQVSFGAFTTADTGVPVFDTVISTTGTLTLTEADSESATWAGAISISWEDGGLWDITGTFRTTDVK